MLHMRSIFTIAWKPGIDKNKITHPVIPTDVVAIPKKKTTKKKTALRIVLEVVWMWILSQRTWRTTMIMMMVQKPPDDHDHDDAVHRKGNCHRSKWHAYWRVLHRKLPPCASPPFHNQLLLRAWNTTNTIPLVVDCGCQCHHRTAIPTMMK